MVYMCLVLQRLLKNWPYDEVTNITWLNEPKSKGEGWESETEDLAVLCSYADYSYFQRWERYHPQPVILMTIPPAEDREIEEEKILGGLQFISVIILGLTGGTLLFALI